MKRMNHISISRIARARGSRDQKGKPHFSKVISVPTDTTPISLNPMTRIDIYIVEQLKILLQVSAY